MVRSDNAGALALVAKLKAHSPNLALIARELALTLAHGVHVPDMVQHLPGIANVIADALSRTHQPGSKPVRSAYLASSVDVSKQVAVRDLSWWKCHDSALPASHEGQE